MHFVSTRVFHYNKCCRLKATISADLLTSTWRMQALCAVLQNNILPALEVNTRPKTSKRRAHQWKNILLTRVSIHAHLAELMTAWTIIFYRWLTQRLYQARIQTLISLSFTTRISALQVLLSKRSSMRLWRSDRVHCYFKYCSHCLITRWLAAKTYTLCKFYIKDRILSVKSWISKDKMLF